MKKNRLYILLIATSLILGGLSNIIVNNSTQAASVAEKILPTETLVVDGRTYDVKFSCHGDVKDDRDELT